LTSKGLHFRDESTAVLAPTTPGPEVTTVNTGETDFMPVHGFITDDSISESAVVDVMHGHIIGYPKLTIHKPIFLKGANRGSSGFDPLGYTGWWRG
jgi:hypothetical protein